jgi:hypothetical protein
MMSNDGDSGRSAVGLSRKDATGVFLLDEAWFDTWSKNVQIFNVWHEIGIFDRRILMKIAKNIDENCRKY